MHKQKNKFGFMFHDSAAVNFRVKHGASVFDKLFQSVFKLHVQSHSGFSPQCVSVSLWTSLTPDQMISEAHVFVCECVMWSDANSCVKNTRSYFEAATVSLRMRGVAAFLSFRRWNLLIWDLLQIFLLCSCSQSAASWSSRSANLWILLEELPPQTEN